ncbi:MAG: butyrate kinase [Coriobacteriales bacterium]
MKKVFAINLGSTSTKVAYSEDGNVIYKETITYHKEDFVGCATFFDQQEIRTRGIKDNMAAHGVKLDELDAIVSRGGMMQPMPVGVFEINEAMVNQEKACTYGLHPSSMGCVIALELANEGGCHAFTADVPSSDELLPIARYTGLPERWRRTMTQTLNARAVVREWAAARGKRYEDVNAITTGLGGGINTIAHCHGRMIDTNNSVDGEGCFSTNRCLTVPIDILIDDCYSGKWTYDEMRQRVSRRAGLLGYLGTADAVEIEKRVDAGDEYAREVVEAMCYQIAKDIGAFATTLKGDVDVIFLAGGMARFKLVTDLITERVSFIAPVEIHPGELEMEALCENAYRALIGDLPVQEFVAAESPREAMDWIDEIWEDSDWTYAR